MLPQRKPKIRSGIERAPRREWPRHRAFVRSHGCCVPGCPNLDIECAHVRVGGNAGTGIKPADWQCLSLCSAHHREQHQLGHAAFDRRHGIDSVKLAAEFARVSPDIAMKEAMKEGGAL